MTKEEQLYLELIRSALWQNPISSSASNFEGLTLDEWKNILKLSTLQRTTAFILEAILSLPHSFQPPKAQMLKLQLETSRIEQVNNALNRTVDFLKRELEELKVSFIMLKGQGVALNYPLPHRRTPGDIDLYFYRMEDYLKVQKWIEEKGYKLEKESKTHQGFNIGNIHVEAHKKLTHFGIKKYDELFKKECGQVVEKNRWQPVAIISHKGSKTTTAASVASFSLAPSKKNESKEHITYVQLLPATFNAAYLFIHLFHHFNSTGISMRHISDWVLHLSVNRYRVDLKEVARILEQFDLTTPAQLVAEIAIVYLGAPAEIFPIIPSTTTAINSIAPLSRKAKLLLEDILKGGHFGRYHKGSIRPKGVWAGRAHSYIHFFFRSLKLAPIAPRLILAVPLLRLTTRIRITLLGR